MTLWAFRHESPDRFRAGIVAHDFDWHGTLVIERVRHLTRVASEVQEIARRSFALPEDADIEVWVVPQLEPGGWHHIANLILE